MRRQVSQILSSRAVFILLYCLFLWSLAVALVGTFLTRLSVPNLVQNFAPALLIGAAALGYWLYVTQIRENGVAFPFEWPPLSPRLLLPLLLAGSLGAVFVSLTGNRVPSAAEVMAYIFYIWGLIGAVLLSALKPYLGICAMLLTLPVALLLHLYLRFQGVSDNFSYVAMNPEILLVLVTFLSMMVGLLVRNWRPARTRLDIPIAIFLLGSVIALFNSPGFLISSRMVFVGTVIPILCYYLIVNGLRSRTEIIVAVSVLLFTFFLMGSYSIMTFQREVAAEALLTGEERLTQFFANPGFFALTLTLILPLPLCLAVFPRTPFIVRFVSGLLFAVLLGALVFTYIRGAWVGFAASLVVLLLLSSEIRRLFLKISPLLVVAFLLWSGIMMQIFWARSESSGAFFQSGSWTDRVSAWQSAWRMIVHNPLTGVGPGLFHVFYPAYRGDYTGYYSWGVIQQSGMDAHNLLLNVGAETGLLAMIGLLGILTVSLWTGQRLFRNAKDPLMKAISLGLFAGLIGYLVGASLHGTMLGTFYFSGEKQSYTGGHTFYLFMVVGLIIALARMKSPS